MAFPLLDDETFTEVLALLDEYNTAVEEPLVPICKNPPSAFSRVSESAAWVAFEAAHPITKNASKHRNGAREMRRREVQFLRTCVDGLEKQLTALREEVEQRAQLRNATLASEDAALMSMWRDLATRQLNRRLASERENSRLKCALEAHNKLREILQQALNTKVAREAMETSLIHEKRTRRVHSVPLEAADREVFQELEVEVDNVYREAANVFDTGGGTSLGVFGEKMLPFDVHTTAEVAWRCLAHAFQHEKCRFSYMRERRKENDEILHDDTVGESFGVEIKAPERMAAFRIKQVFRRYVESEQTVIAWRSFIDTTEFKGQSLQSVRFLEKGSCVIRQPSKLQTPNDEFTLLRIWHVITPESQTRPENMSSEFVQGLTDFVLGVSSSASTVQTIEDMLIDGQCTARHSNYEEHV
ncbi:hypothetical protein F444_13359 [Phytophthora nicotianae P1976]|uniref:M96 mating-specific protein family n=1 Tax=Phytophthora nicotianae P1976 TaxID=1317066 RepID=A0A080ZU06_PHYNI|nr:hypothetical protein F444_13359 [Phytophthora nicotianae P1976]